MSDQSDHILTLLLHAVGPVTFTGQGIVPVTWSELHAYCILSSIVLTPWQAQALIMMSRAYGISHHTAAQAKGSEAPWHKPEKAPLKTQNTQDTLLTGLRGMMKAPS